MNDIHLSTQKCRGSDHWGSFHHIGNPRHRGHHWRPLDRSFHHRGSSQFGGDA